MSAIAYNRLSEHLGEVVDEMFRRQQPVTVSRPDGKRFVMVPEAEWSALQETAYLLSTPANADALRDSLRQLQEGESEVIDIP